MLARGFEGWHLVILGLVVVVLFGARRMPDAARSIGQSLRIFKSELKAGQADGAEGAESPPVASPVPPQAPAQLPLVQPLAQPPAQQSAEETLVGSASAAQHAANNAAPRP